MNFKEIQELIKLINKSNLTEFKMKDGDFEVTVRTKRYHKANNTAQTPAQQPYIPIPTATTFAPPPPTSTPISKEGKTTEATPQAAPASDNASSNYIEIKSPIVGTFYRAASPDKPPYVKVGDTIDVGSVVCIVEAMKLFNEIESEVSGKIVKVMIEDASPVEYDQVLYLVDPAG